MGHSEKKNINKYWEIVDFKILHNSMFRAIKISLDFQQNSVFGPIQGLTNYD